MEIPHHWRTERLLPAYIWIS